MTSVMMIQRRGLTAVCLPPSWGMLEATAAPYYVTLSAEDGSIYKTRSHVGYAMVPVWIVTTRYKDKPYTFMMNGQTGVFVGFAAY